MDLFQPAYLKDYQKIVKKIKRLVPINSINNNSQPVVPNDSSHAFSQLIKVQVLVSVQVDLVPKEQDLGLLDFVNPVDHQVCYILKVTARIRN